MFSMLFTIQIVQARTQSVRSKKVVLFMVFLIGDGFQVQDTVGGRMSLARKIIRGDRTLTKIIEMWDSHIFGFSIVLLVTVRRVHWGYEIDLGGVTASLSFIMTDKVRDRREGGVGVPIFIHDNKSRSIHGDRRGGV